MKILETNGLVDNLYKYVQTNIEITKLEVQERIEEGIQKIIVVLIMILIAAAFSIFLLLTLALFLNEKFHSQYLGFLTVTGLLLVGGIASFIWWKNAEAKDSELDVESAPVELEAEEE